MDSLSSPAQDFNYSSSLRRSSLLKFGALLANSSELIFEVSQTSLHSLMKHHHDKKQLVNHQDEPGSGNINERADQTEAQFDRQLEKAQEPTDNGHDQCEIRAILGKGIALSRGI
jgi:hypothetical protein